jgi:hypothetical protein
VQQPVRHAAERQVRQIPAAARPDHDDAGVVFAAGGENAPRDVAELGLADFAFGGDPGVRVHGAAFARWKQRQGKPPQATVSDLQDDPDLLAEVQQAVDRANTVVSRAEGIKRFRILDASFTVGAELTPLQKVRRSYVLGKYASDVEAVYGPWEAAERNQLLIRGRGCA